MSETQNLSVPGIILYAVSTCNHCKALIDFLMTHNVLFDVTYVDELQGKERKEMVQKVKEVNKRCSFPTTVIGEKVVVGFREDELKEALEIR